MSTRLEWRKHLLNTFFFKHFGNPLLATRFLLRPFVRPFMCQSQGTNPGFWGNTANVPY